MKVKTGRGICGFSRDPGAAAAARTAGDQPGQQLDPSADDLHHDPGAAAAAEKKRARSRIFKKGG